MANNEYPRARSVVQAPVSRVTIAFPFSNIKSQEPSDELRELVAIVGELADHVAKLEPTPETDALADQARALLFKLQR